MAKWAALIKHPDGGEEYVCRGVDSDEVATFTTRLAAREVLDQFLMGMDAGTTGEVVPAPREEKREKDPARGGTNDAECPNCGRVVSIEGCPYCLPVGS
jgi:hypothetical protein